MLEKIKEKRLAWKQGLYAACFSGGLMALASVFSAPLVFDATLQQVLIQSGILFMVGASKAAHRYLTENPIREIWSEQEREKHRNSKGENQ